MKIFFIFGVLLIAGLGVIGCLGDEISKSNNNNKKNIESVVRPHHRSAKMQKSLHNLTQNNNSEEELVSESNPKRSLPIATHHNSSPRFGGSPLGLQKTPPDLQFGLAFTVPFVSLSTDKLINTFNGKSYNGGGGGHGDVSNILKLNLSGLIIAAVVGLAAVLFIPSFIGGSKFGNTGSGGGGGWGGSILDSLIPGGVVGGILDHLGLGNHYGNNGWDENNNAGTSRPFGYQDYYEYNGVHNNRKDQPGNHGQYRSSRKVNGTNISNPVLKEIFKTVGNYAKKSLNKYENCVAKAVCLKAKNKKMKSEKKNSEDTEEEEDLISLIESISGNELIRNSYVSELIRNANLLGNQRNCSIYEKYECF